MTSHDDLTRWATLDEGQFFERKSAFERPGGHPKRRPATTIAWDIVETLSAMANADGGELVIGIEDDGDITGVPHAADKVRLLKGAPRDRNYVHPAIRSQVNEVRPADGKLLLHFVVDWSPDVHRLANGKYLLRVGDSNAPFPAEQIAALKQTKAQALFEHSFPPGTTLDDLDDLLVVGLLGPKIALNASPEELLRRCRLIEPRNGHSVPCLAGLLLFGKDPLRWHPRCGIDFVRWEGTERKHGAELNITKRIRIEEPLAVLIEKAYTTIQPFIRERQHLHDLFFTEKLEYPTFVWQEAIVNAVAHRDYSIQGASIEVWMFDDRIEVRSPGMPPHPVTFEELNKGDRIHLSRNPLIVRALAELGYMRDLGEGIPRMFEEMEREGFYPPRFDKIGGLSFQVTLRNQPIYDEKTLDWLRQFEGLGLTGDHKRLLAYAHARGNRFTSRDYQKLIGLDPYAAANSIKELIKAGVARLTEKRGRFYEVLEALEARADIPADLSKLSQVLKKKGEIGNEDIRDVLGVSRPTATRVARELVRSGWLEPIGSSRWRRYRLARPRMNQPPGSMNQSYNESRPAETDSLSGETDS